MSFGKSAPATPAAQPVTPVPQDDDPSLIEHKRRAAERARSQDGVSAHLLTGESGSGPMGQPTTQNRSKLLPY
jgi:hypothetical protein